MPWPARAPSTVLVADQPHPRRAPPATRSADMVRTEIVPAKTAVAGRVTDLAALAGRVADRRPAARRAAAVRPLRRAPTSCRRPAPSHVPAGLQEVSVLLEPQRAVGGRLAAGDTVGVFVSLASRTGRGSTHAVLHQRAGHPGAGRARRRPTRPRGRRTRPRRPRHGRAAGQPLITLARGAAQARGRRLRRRARHPLALPGARRRRHRRHRRSSTPGNDLRERPTA